jgi:hypothetical protein
MTLAISTSFVSAVSQVEDRELEEHKAFVEHEYCQLGIVPRIRVEGERNAIYDLEE